MADYDRRLVDLYDEDNPDGPDHDFYRALADELDARAVVDLGCGTGMRQRLVEIVTVAEPPQCRVVGPAPRVTPAVARPSPRVATELDDDRGQHLM